MELTNKQIADARQSISDELQIEVQYIQNLKAEDSYVTVAVNGGFYYAKITATGKVKKGSVRKDFS